MLKAKMDELTVKTVHLEEQYQNHIKRLDGEIRIEIDALKLKLKTDLEELAKKELAQKDKMSFSKFFKLDKDKEDDKSKNAKEAPKEVKQEQFLTDEERLELLAKKREEERLKKNKKVKKKETPKVVEPPQVSKKEQALHDKYKVDLDGILEKFNFKCDDLHVLFVEKIISLEKSYGVTCVREVPKQIALEDIE